MILKSAIVVGSGAGGATVAKELEGHFDVTVLEAGGAFEPFSMSLSAIDTFKRTGLMFDEREIQLLFPTMRIRKTREKIVLVKGIGLGGTTTIATGSGVRMDEILMKYGIDLSSEYDELEREVPVSTDHQRRWRKATRQLFQVCGEMGLNPRPTPKMGDGRKCINCGRCVFGCEQGAKWDSRIFLYEAVTKGAKLVTHSAVNRVVIDGSKAIGVETKRGLGSRFYAADLVVLAAGGFGTPVILQNSGIECERSLFVDPVLCVATLWKDCMQNKEISMPFIVQRDGYILSPYFDYLSYFFRKDWNCAANDTLGIMIKVADSSEGTALKNSVEKKLCDRDLCRFEDGVRTCRDIFRKLEVRDSEIFLGTLNAGHPGGTLPLRDREANSFHSSKLPDNMFVADATLLPTSLGNPPIFTIMAMAKRVSRVCLQSA